MNSKGNIVRLILCAAVWPWTVGAANAVVPDRFLSGQDERYPAAAYIRGTGQGESLEEAVARAYGMIAVQVEPRGSSRLDDHQISHRDGATTTTRGGRGQTVTRDLQIAGSLDEWGALSRVVDSYAESGRVFVFAALERRAAASRLRSDAVGALAEMRRQERRFAAALDSVSDREAAAAFRAMEKAAGRISASLARAEQIDDSPAQPEIDLDALKTLAQARDRLQARWRGREAGICIESDGEAIPGAAIRAIVTDLLLARGIVPRLCGFETEDESDVLRFSLRVLSTLSHELGTLGPASHVCRARLQMEITRDSGSVLLLSSVVAPDSPTGANIDRSQAIDISLQNLRAQLDQRLVDLIGF